MRIVCQQTILMKYYALFVIFKKATKFEINYPLHISGTLKGIFIKLHPNVPLRETMCRIYDLYTDSRSRSHFKVMWFTLQFVSAPYLLNTLNDFHLTSLKCSSHSVRQCAQHMTQLPRLKVKVTGKGIYLWILCRHHISWTDWAIFIKLHPNVPLSETMCKTYDLATQSRSHFKVMGYTFQFESAPYLLNKGAQWLSGRVLDSWPRGRRFEPHRRLHCGPWAWHIYPSLVHVQPRKTRPCLTERLLMGRKESNQRKQTKYLLNSLNDFHGDFH